MMGTSIRLILHVAMSASMIALAVNIWIRDGSWHFSEMPTHGMIAVSGLAAMASIMGLSAEFLKVQENSKAQRIGKMLLAGGLFGAFVIWIIYQSVK